MVLIKLLALDLASRSAPLVRIETILFATIAAFVGNLSVCYAVYRNQRLRTISNMFVVALAVSDILMSICCVPFSVVTLYHGQWVFGETLWRFHGFGVITFGLASLHTMGVIAINRYFCVVKPKRYVVLFKKQRILMYIAVIITICYAKVFYTVSRSNKVFSQENNPQMLRANVEEANVTKTLAAVMVGFECCWLLVCIIDYIDAARGEPTLPGLAYLAYGFLAYLSGTINPFIYGVTNKQFRREYKAMLGGMMLCLKSSRCMGVLEYD